MAPAADTSCDTAFEPANSSQSLPQAPAEERIHHIPYDLNYHAKQHGSALLDSLVPLLDACLDVTSLLVHTPAAGPQVAALHLRLSMCGLITANCLAASQGQRAHAAAGDAAELCAPMAAQAAGGTSRRSCC
jgi:hypothetical protein